MNELMKSALETQVPCGSAVLWWLGQMGLMVRLGETLLCLDYFATEAPASQRGMMESCPASCRNAAARNLLISTDTR